MPLTDKDGHLTEAFQSVAERISEQKLESSLIKSLGKIYKFRSVWQETSPNLIVPSLFNSVALHSRGVSTCAKGCVTTYTL